MHYSNEKFPDFPLDLSKQHYYSTILHYSTDKTQRLHKGIIEKKITYQHTAFGGGRMTTLYGDRVADLMAVLPTILLATMVTVCPATGVTT